MAGAPLPSSRALARDLGVSRRLVVEAFAQLAAEGYLVTRQGAGTFVAETAAAAPAPTPAPEPRPPRYDFFPGAPDLSAFPRAAWARAVRDVLRELPAHALSYGDPRGAPALRTALAGYLARARGVVAQPERMVITSGAAQALGLLAAVLVARGTPRIAVEDPSLPDHREVMARRGADVVPVRSTTRGAGRRAGTDGRGRRGGDRRPSDAARRRALGRSPAALLARGAASSSRTTTTPSSATTGRPSARCRAWRPSRWPTSARRPRRSRPGCGSAGSCSPPVWSAVADGEALRRHGDRRDRPAHARAADRERRVRPAFARAAPQPPGAPRRRLAPVERHLPGAQVLGSPPACTST